ncbi:hypothetical protein SDC9_184347 [bioreactor metagenome]|uniref:Uncharacterized protein n=1 Tax=bioreactor metagenome TaxID=1076179 RepID=A0A645HCS4_9ZZZZ
MKPVTGKPADTFLFVDRHHIIVEWRVERHVQLIGREVRIGGKVVSGDEQVVSTQRTVSCGREIEGKAIGHHKRISLIPVLIDGLR